MFIVICVCALLITLTTLVHFEFLTGLTMALPRLRIPPRTKLVVVIFTLFVAHTVEIAVYGLALYLLIRGFSIGGLSGAGGPTLSNSMYFSAETYSSLGFGDVVPTGAVRMLAGAEALNGLLLIGWSASYAYIAMEWFWNSGPSAQGS